MNPTRELLELASLDVLGLLDESEREEFEQSFRAATPEVQAAVRREQLRLAKDDDLLPKVDTPPGLRARVMSAISEAIASVSGQEATIGYVGPAQSRSVMASATLWRAACLGFATAAVVMGGFVYQMSRVNRQIIDDVASGTVMEKLRPIGPTFQKMLTSPSMFNAHFAPLAKDADDHSRATIYVDRELKQAFLLCSDLPPGEYRLVIDNPTNTSNAAPNVAFRHDGGLLKVVHIDQIDPDDVNSLSIVASNGARNESTPIMRIGDGA
ncbi:MAG: hypothetical protein KDA30_11595 [Phycisphaerales bacterium]|nr:hypothetical protein [Phycisphaerales bacterium]